MDDSNLDTARDSSTDDPLRSASAVIVLIHGVGDHRPIDIATETCVAMCWQSEATTARISVPDLPLPDDVNPLSWTQGRQPAATRIQTDAGGLIILPVVWSGSRFRSAWLPRLRDGPSAFMSALPLMFDTCTNLFASARMAHGPWQLWILIAASLLALPLIVLVFGFYYLLGYLPLLPELTNNAWYSDFLFLGCFCGFALVTRYLSTAYDLVGDVAYYVAETEQRQKRIEQVSALIETVTKRAPEAFIIIAGHSLGSVLASQALLRCSSNAAARGRILLLTMGSPLRIMSTAFPDQIESPQALAALFAGSEIPQLWVNLWREQDIIGNALSAGGESFVEGSLGLGPHSNYWGDERVWLAIGTILARDRTLLDKKLWRKIPLSNAEAARCRAMWQRLRFSRLLCLGVSFAGFVYSTQILAPREQDLSTIMWAWKAGWLALGFVGFDPLEAPTAQMSDREFYHHLEFHFNRVRLAAIATCTYLAALGGAIALHTPS